MSDMFRTKLKSELSALLTNKKAFIYGAGEVGIRLMNVIKSIGKENCIAGFVVSKFTEKVPHSIENKMVYEAHELHDKDALIIVAVSDAFQNEILFNLQQLNFANVINGYLYSFLNEDFLPAEMPTDVPLSVTINTDELMAMQFVGEEFEAYDVLNILLSDNKRCCHDDCEVTVDANLQIISGRSFVGDCIIRDISEIKVRQRFDSVAKQYDLHWAKDNIDRQSLDKLQKMLCDYENKWRKPFIGIVWQSAVHFYEEIVEELSKYGTVLRATKRNLKDDMTADFIRAVYGTDDVEEQLINKTKSNQIGVVEFILPNPAFRIKRFGHTISDRGIKVKTEIRKKFRPYINNYIQDVIFHTADNYEQATKVREILRRYTS